MFLQPLRHQTQQSVRIVSPSFRMLWEEGGIVPTWQTNTNEMRADSVEGMSPGPRRAPDSRAFARRAVLLDAFRKPSTAWCSWLEVLARLTPGAVAGGRIGRGSRGGRRPAPLPNNEEARVIPRPVPG